ncbi:beta-ketoacyl synthase N-terminal-like domain-containing protein [Paracoccus aminophilus]|uniref:6-deoxyerythronolide-B synthase n=1 Tax=Paracoccus aminophilus JCM 7686 TaxID=1367847 RepID=S5YSC3_PARAH|nr:beta-ketoacyl synthase N-terminal-like domain-containing protein [Paracoccus aminophilus]AGT08111.1 6-deoxyerythronolide-B synthase [Paracoccus aminophilus JCM 7686]
MNAKITEMDIIRQQMVAIDELKKRLSTQATEAEPLAIVGMACRFGGKVQSLDGYWDFLASKGNAVSTVPAARAQAFAPEDVVYTQKASFLDDITSFDAAFFGISAREAASMDPQQRLLLEVSHEALEDAGHPIDRKRGDRVGVFVGIMASDYGELVAARRPAQSVDPYHASGRGFCFAAGRISYTFGFRGPSLAIDTACSSSLVALETARKSILSDECDFALVAGVNVILSPAVNAALCKAQALSPEGVSKAFSADADGYGRGEGCGALVLKRLSDARRDGNRIYALYLGGAVNHDGPSSGLTVPSGPAQTELLRRAWRTAGVAPEQLDFVETHGTGTKLGDPIEIRALADALGARETSLPIGSVKANIGHTESASGLASVIKAALMLSRRRWLPQLLTGEKNPLIDWAKTPLDLAADSAAWATRDAQRVVGVSSFGLSGTNAHVVLGEAIPGEAEAPAPEAALPALLLLSAKTTTALKRLIAQYRQLAPDWSTEDLAAICRTTRKGRAHHKIRCAVVAETGLGLQAALDGRELGEPGHESAIMRWPVGDDGSEQARQSRDLLARLEGTRRAGALFTSLGLQPEQLFAPGYEQVTALAVQIVLLETLQALRMDLSKVQGEALGGQLAAWARGEITREALFAQALTDTPPGGAGDWSLIFEVPATSRRSEPEPPSASLWTDLLALLGQVYETGASLDWAKLDGAPADPKAPGALLGRAPHYLFDRQRHWLAEVDQPQFPTNGTPVSTVQSSTEKEKPVQETAGQSVGVADSYTRFDESLLRYGSGRRAPYLHWAPFAETPDFSWLKVFCPEAFDGGLSEAQESHYLNAISQMRAQSLRGIDFSQVERVLDVGCGYGTDVFDLAAAHDHLRLDAYNITLAQVDVVAKEIAARNLGRRVRVFHRDSAKDPFPDQYQLAFAYQVVHHVEDKAALLANVADHLDDGGLFVLTDIMAEVDERLEHLDSEARLLPIAHWVTLFAEAGFRVLSVVDASEPIGNFLHDPDFDRNIQTLREHISAEEADFAVGPHMLGRMLRKRLARYSMLTLQRDRLLTKAALLQINAALLAAPVPYARLSAADLGFQTSGEARRTQAASGAGAGAEISARRAGDASGDGAAIAAQVEALIREALEMPESARLPKEAELMELGVDSFTALLVVQGIKRELGLNYEMSELLGPGTLGDHIDRVVARAQQARESSVRAADASQGIDELSDEEVLRLLAEEQALNAALGA